MFRIDRSSSHARLHRSPHHEVASPRTPAGWARFQRSTFEDAPRRPEAADLAPTPLSREEIPGQISEVNTPKNKKIARRSQFNDAVNQAIDAVRARGVGIDPEDRDSITDFDAYHGAVVTELRRRGFNAAHDGEELSVGRRGDNFNEQFDISTWTGRVRRFYAAYVSPPVWAQS